MMLTKNTHNKAGYFSRLMALPIAVIVFAAFTLQTKTVTPTPYKGKIITVVIDAGHGGKDFGASDGNVSFEKDITLSIAKKIKELNSNSTINILLTRETDVYQSPPEKATLINNLQADLAITIHADAYEKNISKFNSGMSFSVVLDSKDTFSNLAQSKILASALIQTFQNNYPLSIRPQPIQREKGIWILQASKCPIVLIEAGYITDKKDLAFLLSEQGKEIIATNILRGIEKYVAAKVANAEMQ